MTIDRRKLLRAGAAAGLVSALPARARAQNPTQAWPTRFVRLIVPFAAGGANEAFARNLERPTMDAMNETTIKGGSPWTRSRSSPQRSAQRAC